MNSCCDHCEPFTSLRLSVREEIEDCEDLQRSFGDEEGERENDRPLTNVEPINASCG